MPRVARYTIYLPFPLPLTLPPPGRLNCDEGNGYDSGYSGRDSASSLILNNPDFQNSIPQVGGRGPRSLLRWFCVFGFMVIAVCL